MKAKAKITAVPTRRARGKSSPLVAVVMGSANDWDVMQKSVEILRDFAVPFEARVVSAHRTPDVCLDYAAKLEARGVRAVIAGAGGAAHLPGVIAAKTRLPVWAFPSPPPPWPESTPSTPSSKCPPESPSPPSP